MKIYFLSSQPCALFVGDAFLGTVDGFERWMDIPLADNAFVRFCPQNALPIQFFLNEQIRFRPPNGVDAYLLKDALALYARAFVPTDFNLRVIAQKKEKQGLATLFSQGGVQLSLQSPDGFFVASLPPSFEYAKLDSYAGLWFVSTHKRLAVFNTKAELLLMKNVDAWRVETNTLFAQVPILGKQASVTFDLSDSRCTHLESRIETSLPTTACAFFESLLNGLNCDEMLSDELREKADDIPAFLGDFRTVIPTHDTLSCKLVYQKTNGVFNVRQMKIQTENGKICDIAE